MKYITFIIPQIIGAMALYFAYDYSFARWEVEYAWLIFGVVAVFYVTYFVYDLVDLIKRIRRANEFHF